MKTHSTYTSLFKSRTWRCQIILLILFSGLIGAALSYDAWDFNYTGLPLVFKHMLDIAITIYLVVIAMGVGRMALALTKCLSKHPAEALLFCSAIGLGLVGNVVLLLGLAGKLAPEHLLAVFVALTLIAGTQMTNVIGMLRSVWILIKKTYDSWPVGTVSLFVLTGVTFFMVFFAVAPPADWDALMYHLQLPKLFVQEHRIFVPEDSFATSFMGLAHMLYVPLLVLGNHCGPALLSVFMGLLLSLGTLSFSEEVFDKRVAVCAFIILWATTPIVLVAITPRVDIMVSLFALLSLYAASKYLLFESSQKNSYLSAILAGLTVAVKFSAILFVVSLVPLVMRAFFARHRLRSSFRAFFVWGFLFIFTVLPWAGKNWLCLHSPVYPFFSDRMLQHWLASCLGNEGVPESIDAGVYSIIDSGVVPLNIFDAFFAPERISIEGEAKYYYPCYLFLLLPFSLFFIKNRAFRWIVVPPLFFVSLMRICFPINNFRYLLSAVAPLTIATSYVIVVSSRKIGGQKIALYISLLVALSCLIPSAYTAHIWMSQTRAINHALGLTAGWEYLKKLGIGGIANFVPVIDYVNANLSRENRVLMLFEARGYYFLPDVIQDDDKTNWPLLSEVRSSETCLKRNNITHVLLGRGSVNYYIERNAKARLFKVNEFEEFADRYLNLIYDTPRYSLYEIKSMVGETGEIGKSERN